MVHIAEHDSMDLLQTILFFSAPLKASSLWGPLSKWDGIAQLDKEFIAYNIQRPTRHWVPFLVVGGVRFNNLTLERISQYAPHHWTPRNFTEVEGP